MNRGAEIIGLLTSTKINTEDIGECRIGAVAPLQYKLRDGRPGFVVFSSQRTPNGRSLRAAAGTA
jgi:hypothetical protein